MTTFGSAIIRSGCASVGCLRTGMAIAATGGLTAGPVAAHEAWLLTPSEIERLALAPMPALFTSMWALGLASAIGGALAFGALRIERATRAAEARLMGPAAAAAPPLGALAVRLGLAAMLALAAVGGLPRHGTLPWAEPTFLVPDMPLALAPGWEWLALAQAILAASLAVGFLTRLCGMAVVALALLGLAVFGPAFLAYAPHFAAPGLLLAIVGGGTASLDHALRVEPWLRPGKDVAAAAWAGSMALIGGGFVYLAVTFKLMQPTLIMEILDKGEVPLLGVPLAVAALAMAGVEIIAGTLFAVGRLTRPVALFLIGAFTFFAVTLGETPLFHANLYGAMALFVLAGRTCPAPQREVGGMQAVTA